MLDERFSLRQEFPQFRIWREIIAERTRYVARRLHPPTSPHTVVADDLAELRTALGTGARPLPDRAPASPASP